MGNSLMELVKWSAGLTSVGEITNPAKSTVLCANLNLVGFRVIPFLPSVAQSGNHSTHRGLSFGCCVEQLLPGGRGRGSGGSPWWRGRSGAGSL